MNNRRSILVSITPGIVLLLFISLACNLSQISQPKENPGITASTLVPEVIEIEPGVQMDLSTYLDNLVAEPGTQPIISEVRPLTDLELQQYSDLEVVPGFDIEPTEYLTYDPNISQMDFGLSTCNPIPFSADLVDKDGIKENYLMISLLECNGENLVSPPKSQREGSCGTFSSIAALETLLGAAYSEGRPETDYHPIDDFLPINLSEGYLMFGEHAFVSSAPVFDGIEDRTWRASTFEYYYPEPEMRWNWGEWDNYRADALENHYSQITSYCQDLKEPNLSDLSLETLNSGTKAEKNAIWGIRFKPFSECLFDAAKQQNLVFIDIGKEYSVRADLCVDTATGEGGLPCNQLTSFGNPGEQYQVDYQTPEDWIKFLLITKNPVRLSVLWQWNRFKTTFVPSTNQYFDYHLLYPRDLADYVGNPKAGYSIPNSSGHSVLIVGFLQGEDDNDYWIIKNSHASRTALAGNKAIFYLVRTPGTSGNADTVDSTKRNIFLSGSGSRFTYYTDLNFYQLNPSTDTTEKARATGNNDLVFHDSDDDGIWDIYDNCPANGNTSQKDQDKDFVGDECDLCFQDYDRYQDRSNPNLFLNDLDNDGYPVFCDPDGSPDEGLTVLTPFIDKLDTHINNWNPGVDFRKNDWEFQYNNSVEAVGDFNGDGYDDFILKNNAGIAVVQTNGNGLHSSFSVGNRIDFDTQIGSWILRKTDKIVGVGQFNLDNNEEILIQGQDGLAVFSVIPGSNPSELSSFAIGDRIGGWRVGIDDVIVGVGRFSPGIKTDEFIIRSDWGIGIISSDNNASLSSTITIPMADPLGEWKLNPGDEIYIGNYDGQTGDEILFKSSWGLGIVKMLRNNLSSVAMMPSGNRIGGWNFSSIENQVIAIGDLNGDGSDEFVLRSGWGIGIISYLNGELTTLDLHPYDDRIDSWRLGEDDLILGTGDFSGKSRQELFFQSDWGIGILYLNDQNNMVLKYAYPYGSLLGNWAIRPENVFLGFGNFILANQTSILIKVMDQ